MEKFDIEYAQSGDLVRLVGVIEDPATAQWPYDPERSIHSVIVRINRDHSTTPVFPRFEMPVTVSCACHPLGMRFGWIEQRAHRTSGHPSFSVVRFVDGAEVSLDDLRAEHSCVTMRVW